MLAAPKKLRSYRTSEETDRMLAQIAAEHDVTQSAAIQLAIREYHKRLFRGRKPPETPKKKPERS